MGVFSKLTLFSRKKKSGILSQQQQEQQLQHQQSPDLLRSDNAETDNRVSARTSLASPTLQSTLLEAAEREQQKSWLQRLSPLESPLLWMNLSTICAGYAAAIMLIEIEQDDDEESGADEDAVTEHNYIIFDTISTILWSFIAWSNWIHNDHRSGGTNTVEVIVAVLFCIMTSLNVLSYYCVPSAEDGEEFSAYIDITATILLVKFICFFLQLLDTIRVFRNGGWKGEYKPIDYSHYQQSYAPINQSLPAQHHCNYAATATTPARNLASSRKTPLQNTALAFSDTVTTADNNNSHFYDTLSSISPGINSSVHNALPKTECNILAYRCVDNARQCLIHLTPLASPLLWANLNALFAIYSALLLWLVYEGDTDDDDNNSITGSLLVFAKEHYLLYDFLTTVFWCWQALLHLEFFGLDDETVIDVVGNGSTDNHQNNSADDTGWSPWATKLELVLASVFLIVSGRTLYLWKFSDQDPDIVAVAVLLNLASYLFQFFECLNVFHTRYLQMQYQQHEGGTTEYNSRR